MFCRLSAACLGMALLAGCANMPLPFTGTPHPAMASTGSPAAAAPTPVSTDPRVASLTAAGVAPLHGAAIASYMDREQAELQTQLQSTGVTVSRAGTQIALVLPAGLLFDSGAAVIKPQFAGILGSIGAVMKHFDRTTIDVYGYMDAGAAPARDQDLSQRRAVAVATMLAGQGVNQQRFYIEGRGSADPIASNATEAGREQNRRIEIQLAPLT